MNNDSTPYASAIGAANQTGSFLFSPMKPALSYGDQVRRMQERGLAIDDHARMSRLLTTLFMRGYAENASMARAQSLLSHEGESMRYWILACPSSKVGFMPSSSSHD